MTWKRQCVKTSGQDGIFLASSHCFVLIPNINWLFWSSYCHHTTSGKNVTMLNQYRVKTKVTLSRFICIGMERSSNSLTSHFPSLLLQIQAKQIIKKKQSKDMQRKETEMNNA